MRQAVAETDALQRLFGLFFVRDAVKILSQHHVFQRREIRHEMKLLENETHFFRTVANQVVFAELRQIHAVDDHASPRNTDAGRMLASRRNGKALRIATSTVKPTATGYTIRRGRAATPKTALPRPIESRIPSAAPITPPARPSSAASARNSRTTRRVAPPMAFIKPTSILRSMATLVIAAMTHSAVNSSTMPTVAVSRPLMRL